MVAKSRKTPQPPISSEPPADTATAWARDVVAGRVVAGPHIRNACRRHLDDLEKGPARGLTWDLAAANKALGFFRDVLRLNGGQFEGRPFTLHPSQAFRVGSLFGWKRADGSRRFRRFYDEEAKGNGKSPLLAGIGMWCLLADGEDRAEVYAAASKKDQAMVLFRDAVAMFQQSPALAARLTPSGGNPIWNLADLKTGSFFRPISSEDGQSGPRPSCALCDEVHEHRNGTIIEMLERGFKWRRQPILLMATNSGSDRQSVCWQEHQHAVRVAAGTREPDEAFTYVGEVIDDETFSFVCSLDPKDDPLEDPSCWIKANPLLGVTVQPDYLAGVVRQAKAIPGKLNNILRLHFCQWTEADTAWMARPALEACLAEFEPESEHSGAPVFVGLDLSATQDMTAMAFVVPTGTVSLPRDDGTVADLPTFDAWVEAWTPRDTLTERALRDNAPYDLWEREGWLQAAPGKMVRFDFVAARLAELVGVFEIRTLAYDSYGFKKHFEPELDALGVGVPLIEHPQGGKKKGAESGLWMPGSKLALEQLILEGRIRLRRSPVLISAMMSAGMESDPFGNAWFSKRRAVNRIDALIALAMAVGAATGAAGETGGSIFDDAELWS
ncbi:terminase large subunit [Paracraurococcus lichenis]|uniref:Terminase large subunit n=1 Tax=Paracraurococcus lichenis TaxID=3064888 RepID=A0ABT9E8P8_9PROT|nr:terminase TerL endonuclease subunit [Paracraurococcus sp. LOR1-02]MDO9712445.1 terminase large subunit [Paracraurococcus sp. LOR1-02]